jgi:hypothetical protein
LLFGGAFLAVLVLRWFWPMPILGHATIPLLGLVLLLLGLAIVIPGRRALVRFASLATPSTWA